MFKRLILAIAALSFLGFVDASYLTADHYLKLPLPCTITHGCDTVLTSRYATVGFIPVSVFGVLYYLAILLLGVYFYTSENPSKKIIRTIFGFTCVGLIASCYLIYLQLAVIHAICMYCMGSALITFLLFVLSLILFRAVRGGEGAATEA